MVRIRKGTQKDIGKQGIHLINPDFATIWRTKEDAQIKGFKTIWVHHDTVFKVKKRLKKVV